jgi:hypothetical protein
VTGETTKYSMTIPVSQELLDWATSGEYVAKYKAERVAWWAGLSRKKKLKHRTCQVRCWISQQWYNFRFWLSNLIYKHESGDW